jgi:hypothetical protein
MSAPKSTGKSLLHRELRICYTQGTKEVREEYRDRREKREERREKGDENRQPFFWSGQVTSFFSSSWFVTGEAMTREFL